MLLVNKDLFMSQLKKHGVILRNEQDALWKLIALKLKCRTPYQCKAMFNKIKAKTNFRQLRQKMDDENDLYSPFNDKKLIDFICLNKANKDGVSWEQLKQWMEWPRRIADLVGRWHTLISVDLYKNQFTEQEISDINLTAKMAIAKESQNEV